MNTPKICVAIPINSVSIYENKALLSKVIDLHPDFIEFRFDYIEEPIELTSDFIQILLDFTEIPTICTFRKKFEGGHSDVSESERINILKNIIDAKPDFIDVEMDSSVGLMEEIVPLIIKNEIALIFSHHDFKNTPLSDEMHNIIMKFISSLKNIILINENIMDNFVWKLIFTAKRFEDNLEVLKFCRNMALQNKRIISFCMGELGIFSRLLSTKIGGFLTYSSLIEETAPGQINIEKMREFYSLFQI